MVTKRQKAEIQKTKGKSGRKKQLLIIKTTPLPRPLRGLGLSPRGRGAKITPFLHPYPSLLTQCAVKVKPFGRGEAATLTGQRAKWRNGGKGRRIAQKMFKKNDG